MAEENGVKGLAIQADVSNADDVSEMFKYIYQKVKQEDFLQMTSLNGEIPFWIVSYNPEQELEITKAYGGLLKKLERKGSNSIV